MSDAEIVVEHRNKFEYLPSLYSEYESQIDVIETSFIFEDIRPILFKLHEDIFDEFIIKGAVNEINISYGIRLKLMSQLGDDTKMDNFECFSDFLHLYDAAIIEVYQLTKSMYNFEFKSYVESKRKNAIV